MAGSTSDGMDRFQLFATPLLVRDLPGVEALNRELAERLLAEEQTAPGVARSNAGGWHSAPDLGRRSQPCFGALLQRVVDCAGELVAEPGFRYGVQAWAMIMRDGDYAALHDHGEAHWSCVYYVDAGDDAAEHPRSGRLAFVDPRRGGRPMPLREPAPSTFLVRPRTGALVIFPSYLQHYVHPYRGARPRISISCNLVVE
jgi:uncharacterized protein (TIGR02466 family)